MRATENNIYAKRERAPFDPASAAHRVACQLFRGFSNLPAPVLVSLEPYAALFDPAVGPLGLEDREAIAAAVAEIVSGMPVAGAPSNPESSVRASFLARFTIKLLARSFAVDGVDLEQLVRAGFSREEVGAAAEMAIGYHMIARLTAAAQGHRPPLCEQLRSASSKAAFAA